MMDPFRAFDYHPYYCEENIYRLARTLVADSTSGPPRQMDQHPDSAHVVFITNEARQFALCMQRAGREHDGLCIWDYHVILQMGHRVYDLDTRLSCPVETREWLESSAPTALYEAYPDLAPQCILVQAERFLEEFSSDRRHMRSADGSFVHPPPPWPAPYDSAAGHNLPAFLAGDHPAIVRTCALSELPLQ